MRPNSSNLFFYGSRFLCWLLKKSLSKVTKIFLYVVISFIDLDIIFRSSTQFEWMFLYCVSSVQHSREHLPLEAKEKRRAVSEENKECTDTTDAREGEACN